MEKLEVSVQNGAQSMVTLQHQMSPFHFVQSHQLFWLSEITTNPPGIGGKEVCT